MVAYVHACSVGTVAIRLLCPWDFSRPEYWSGLPLFFFRGSSQPRVQTWVSWVSRISRWILYHSTTWEVLTMIRYQHRKLCGLILNKLLIASTLGDCRIPQGILCLCLERIKLICLIDAGWAMPCFRRWNRSDVIYHFWTEVLRTGIWASVFFSFPSLLRVRQDSLKRQFC